MGALVLLGGRIKPTDVSQKLLQNTQLAPQGWGLALDRDNLLGVIQSIGADTGNDAKRGEVHGNDGLFQHHLGEKRHTFTDAANIIPTVGIKGGGGRRRPQGLQNAFLGVRARGDLRNQCGAGYVATDIAGWRAGGNRPHHQQAPQDD